MLVLTRQVGQWLWIGDARIQIRRIRPSGAMEVVIEAPEHVHIVREEAYVKTKADDPVTGQRRYTSSD
jgi:carbon storage regulator CsrA